MSGTSGLRLRVLDLADASGVLCTRLLVGLGAEVIRIEPPGGDPLRAAPVSGLPFSHWNAGKRSVCLDPAQPDGRELLLRQVETADVLVGTRLPGRAPRGTGASAQAHGRRPAPPRRASPRLSRDVAAAVHRAVRAEP